MAVSSVTSKSLLDTFGRIHNYLRISLTERCNLRCGYCMPKDGVKLTPDKECLSLHELKYLSQIFVKSCGITKVRLTGGEPTIDAKLVPLVVHLNQMREYGLKTIAMTTNGILLKKDCAKYKELGLNALNISLDTLRPDRFARITRRRGLNNVLEGLKLAIKSEFESVKLNCVVIRGFNDDELDNFVILAKQYPIEVRFIEFMPFFGNEWTFKSMISYREMFEIISRNCPNLEQVELSEPGGTSKVFKAPGMVGTIGFITSMTNNFCSDCNRLRITSDGHLKVCLFGREENSLKDLLRNGATENEIVKCIQTALFRKKRQHAGRRMFHSSSNQFNCENNNASFSHIDQLGRAKMVNVGPKSRIRRVALAQGEIEVGENVIEKIKNKTMAKGDILTVSKIAGIMGAKMTSNLIPMCHQIPLDYIQVDIEAREDIGSLVVKAKVEAEHKTGVEMECLTAVSVTLLTIYDMCKSVKGDMRISNIKLIYKNKPEIRNL